MSRFEDEGNALVQTLARQAELKVLIWGPGDPGEGGTPEEKEAWEKRCRMRRELEGMFPESEFMFSEEIKIEGMIDQLTEEALHAERANIVIVLDVSRGTHLELDHFTTHYQWFPSKVYVFVPQKYLGSKSLVEEVFKKIPTNQIRGFTEEEFKQCDVAKRLSPDIVKTVAVKRYLERKEAP